MTQQEGLRPCGQLSRYIDQSVPEGFSYRQTVDGPDANDLEHQASRFPCAWHLWKNESPLPGHTKRTTDRRLVVIPVARPPTSPTIAVPASGRGQ